jgi:uncharacterized damage-inducible protein DinB
VSTNLQGMTAHDPALDRLLRHMAWANGVVAHHLSNLSEPELACTVPGSEWTVAEIFHHVVGAAGGYAARLEGAPRPLESPVPATGAQITELARVCADHDDRLRAAAAQSAGRVSFDRNGTRIEMERSTILAQMIHHATEHRAQIAGILAAHGRDVIDLDAIDLWAFASWEDNV